jgi:hypothetical protein
VDPSLEIVRATNTPFYTNMLFYIRYVKIFFPEQGLSVAGRPHAPKPGACAALDDTPRPRTLLLAPLLASVSFRDRVGEAIWSSAY